ncbi:MAG: TolC family protein [Candidatus Zixiibacteriota bacterium]
MRLLSTKVCALPFVLLMLSGSIAAETLTLDQCIELALKNRANIIIARGGASQAGADYLRALGQFLPNVDASYSRSTGEEYDIQQTGDTTSTQEFGPNKRFTINGSVDIVNVATWFNFFGAGADKSAAHLSSINTEQELIFDVKLAYYDHLRSVQNEDVNKQAVERSKEQLKLVESRYELGSAAYSDVLGQRVQYGNDQLEYLRAQNAVTSSRAFLSYTIGIDPSVDYDFATVEETREYDGTMQEAIGFGLDHEPGLLASAKDVKASKLALKSAWADYIPTLSFFGSYKYFDGTQAFPTAFDRSSKSKTFGIQASFNIFDGFGRQRNITYAKVNRNNKLAEFSDARNQVMQQIKAAYLGIQNQKEAVSVAQGSVNSAEENMKIVQERYNLGAATILDLLQAQEDLKRAQVSLINSKFDLNLAIARLENAMGKP